jgi:hypothetical protein
MMHGQKNIKLCEKLLAVVYPLQRFKIYIYQCKITLFRDNKTLSFLHRCFIAYNRAARWMVQIQEYDLEIRHIKGVHSYLADILSRSPSGMTDILSRSSSGMTDILSRSPSGMTDILIRSPSGMTDILSRSPSGMTDILSRSPSGMTDEQTRNLTRPDQVMVHHIQVYKDKDIKKELKALSEL